eukprot:Gb_38839 [translate_table: standard]
MRQLERIHWRVVCSFIFLLVCLVVGIRCLEGDECLRDERDSLLALKSGFDDRMGRLHSWKGLNCCSWEGILCSPSNGHIITLDLRNPKKHWYVDDWALRGSINNALFRLQHLEYLDLSGSDFNTPIPPEIGAFKYLRYLKLSAFPLNWETYHGYNTWISPAVSCKAASLSWEASLDCGTWTSLVLIWTFQLLVLSLRSCNIVGEIPSVISTQSELYSLDLSDNRLAGGIPSWLWDLPLNYLNMSHNLFNMPLPLPNSFRWEIVDLSENQFNGFIPTQIGEYDCQDLIYLSLRRNNFSGSIPPLSQCSLLVVLDLSDNHLSGSLPPGLSNCSYLMVLNLANNELHGGIPEQLGMLQYLEALQLSHNRLSGPLPTKLENCTLLQILDVGYNNITGDIPRWSGNLSELIVLSLKFNHFTGTIPSQMIRLRKLQILDLSFNKLKGELLQNLTTLQAMAIPPKDMDLIYEVQFNDSESANFSYKDEKDVINKGQEMHCVQNILSLGEIPKELGGMSALESLDVSENELSGKIPWTLQSLTALEYLNVSNNKLSGRIPEGNQFLTFNAPSFEVNIDLCGRQLNKECGDGSSDDWPAAPHHLSNASGEEEDEEEEEIPWWNVGVGLSYGVGLSGVYFVLAMNRRWRREYFRLMDKIIVPIVVRMGFM